MSIKDVLVSASNIVNSVLGDVCTYEHQDGGITTGIYIVVDRNKIVKDDLGIIAGYRVEASILKEDIPKIYNEEFFTDNDGVKFKITQITKETKAKWYVDIVEC